MGNNRPNPLTWNVNVTTERLQEIAALVYFQDDINMDNNQRWKARKAWEADRKVLALTSHPRYGRFLDETQATIHCTLEARPLPRFRGMTLAEEWTKIREEVESWDGVVNATAMHHLALIDDPNFFPTVHLLALGAEDVHERGGHPIVASLHTQVAKAPKRRLSALWVTMTPDAIPIDAHVLLVKVT